MLATTAVPVGAEPLAQPTYAELTEVCEYVAGIEPDRGIDYTIRSGVFDVNGDGTPETVYGTLDGSMAIETFDVRNPDGTQRHLEYVGFEWKDIGGLGSRWLLYRDRAYMLTFSVETARVLRYLAYVNEHDELRIGCTFNTAINARLSVYSERFRAVCRAAGQGSIDPIEPDLLAVPRRFELPSMVSRLGSITVDFANEGASVELDALHFSGGGRGCEADYFDLPGTTGEQEMPEARQLLYDIQGMTPSRSRPSPAACRLPVVQWFEFDGQVYLEHRYRGFAPYDEADALHWVRTIVNGEVQTACQASFGYDWQVAEILNPAR